MNDHSILRSEAIILPRKDTSTWDRFVQRYPGSLIYQTASWRNAIEQAFPHIQGDFLVIKDADSREILAGLPIYTVNSWILGRRLVSVPFAPIGVPLVADDEHAKTLVRTLMALKVAKRAKYIDIRLRAKSAPYTDTGLFTNSDYVHHFIVIEGDSKSLFSRLARTSVQQEVKKAMRLGVKVSDKGTNDEWQRFHELLTLTRRRLSLPPIPKSFFDALRHHLGSCATLLSAHRDGVIMGSLLLTEYGSMCSAEFIGDTRTADKAHPAHLLYWHAIERSLTRGFGTFSFGRTARSNEELIRFKQRWGTTEEVLARLTDRPPAGHKSRETSLIYKTARTITRHLPDTVFHRFGQFVYKHIG